MFARTGRVVDSMINVTFSVFTKMLKLILLLVLVVVAIATSSVLTLDYILR